MRIARLLLLLFLAPAILAQTTITFDPPDPTSTTPVTMLVTEIDTCPPPAVVKRSGFRIDVILGTGPCLSAPVTLRHELELGVLEAGTYTIVVTDTGTIVATATLTVLDANNSVVVRPAMGPTTGGSVVEIFANVAGTPSITFDGVPATNVTVVRQYHFRATTPPHAAGAVEVRVGDKSSYAFRYYDPTKPPHPAFFERVLVPVAYNGPGASGSMWTTEVAMRNSNTWPVTAWALNVIAPLRPATLMLNAPGGLFLFIPRGERVHLNAFVRDTSHEIGAELPIVRERDFSTGPLELLNIPAERRYRHTLRIYSPTARFATVTAFDMTDGRVIAQRLIELGEPVGLDRPWFAMVGDFPATFRTFPLTGRVGIRVEQYVPGTELWAFVTVTDNATHEVRVVSPQ